MVKRTQKRSFGELAYTIGTVIAVIMGLGTTLEKGWASNEWIIFALVIVGLVIGFKNITAKEVTPFLIGTIALLTVIRIPFLQMLDLIPYLSLGTFLTAALEFFIIMIGSAAIVVSFKVVYGLAK